MNLQYPSGAGAALDSDYVTFTPIKYRTNAEESSGRAAPPASSGADTITLYMPNSTPGVGNGNSWASASFLGPLGELRKFGATELGGIAGSAMGGKIKSTDDLMQQVKGSISKYKSDIGVGGSVKALGQKGMQMAGGAMGVSPNQMLALGAGAVFNPNVELLYEAPAMRPFSMNFDFVPKNAQEAQVMNRIIMNFKKWSAPLDLENGMFEIPHVWQVRYMTGRSENKNMNKFKKAACTNVQVQANSATAMHVAHDGGVPIITSLSLSFMEVDIITRKDHESAGGQGY